MELLHIDSKTRGVIRFIRNERDFRHRSGLFTIALNSGEAQTVFINGIGYCFPSLSLLPLCFAQRILFEDMEAITAWQYDSDFYWGNDFRRESDLFFRLPVNRFILLDETQRQKLEMLQNSFIEEFNTTDAIKTDMLHMLLKQLIIIATRLAGEQGDLTAYAADRFELIRQYSLLVESNFRTQHQVQYYAAALNRSPKTLSNLFAQHNWRSPLLIIHDRIIVEAKRLFYYTELSAKEVAYELGFEDAAHFGRFFKNLTNLSVSEFKRGSSYERAAVRV